MIRRHPFFKLFLIVYGGVLLLHVCETGFHSWQLFAGVLGGMAVALVAHRGHGYAPLVFLVGHMLIEWHHHAVHGSHYNSKEFLYHGTHAVLDMVFLSLEAKEHFRRYALLFICVVILALACTFCFSYVPARPTFAVSPFVGQMMELRKVMEDVHHPHDEGVLHHMVIGGMLGCIISHFIWKRDVPAACR